MYSALYRRLPGGKVAKLLQLAALTAALLAFLFFVAFPIVDSYIPEDPSING
jgi:hypothetical protein